MTILVAIAGREMILTISGDKYIEAYPVMLVLLIGVPIAAFIASMSPPGANSSIFLLIAHFYETSVGL